jgi:glycosyltransferase involved in cell wall biosynthesis
VSPLVSIIIPVYNSAKYLAECIDSALAQTWISKEIIIVDDGSTDNSLNIARKFDNKTISVFQQENKGASVARNKGLAEAKGGFIQFLDADDLLSANKITDQLNLLLQHPGKIAVCSTVHFFSNQNPFESSSSPYEDSFLYETDDPAGFLSNLYGGNNNRGSMIQTNAWLTPMEIIKKAGCWSEFYSPDDDGEFFCRVVLASQGIVYANDCFNYYRKYKQNESLASVKTKKALHGKFESFLLKKQHLLNATTNVSAKKALAHGAMDLALEAYLVDKKLTCEILTVIEDLGGTDYIPQLGGKNIEFIKKTFGWKTARIIQFYYANIFRNKYSSAIK